MQQAIDPRTGDDLLVNDVPSMEIRSDEALSAPFTLTSSPRVAAQLPSGSLPPREDLCAVWVEQTSGQAKDDASLLRDLEGVLGLSAHALPRTESMDRPQFRLVEAMPRPVAERVAMLALGEGPRPRVVDCSRPQTCPGVDCG